MPKQSEINDDPLAPRIRDWPREDLVTLLVELAGTYPGVDARLRRHALIRDPAALAAQFRHRLDCWRRPSKFLARSQANTFGLELERWLEEIERELLPVDAERALELAEAFVQSDAMLFEQADDSDGAIGTAVGAGCRLWLLAAKALSGSARADALTRLYLLVVGDQYGARSELLRRADLFLQPDESRVLVGRFERDLQQALRDKSEDAISYGAFNAAGCIGLLADALRDPDLWTQNTLRDSPHPNALQIVSFAERYIAFGRPAEALRWLEGDWGFREGERERLLAQAHEALGDRERLHAIRLTIFNRTGTASDFRAWLDTLESPDRESARAQAYVRAREHDNPLDGALLLMALEDGEAAEAMLVDRSASLRGERYGDLVPLAQTLEALGRRLGTIACLRALLVSILTRAYARAYGHAAEYLGKLRELDAHIADYGAMDTHATFEETLRTRHRRKTGFWQRVAAR